VIGSQELRGIVGLLADVLQTGFADAPGGGIPLPHTETVVARRGFALPLDEVAFDVAEVRLTRADRVGQQGRQTVGLFDDLDEGPLGLRPLILLQENIAPDIHGVLRERSVGAWPSETELDEFDTSIGAQLKDEYRSAEPTRSIPALPTLGRVAGPVQTAVC
jgi:hypothetical protein